jgi:hypothetical protein
VLDVQWRLDPVRWDVIYPAHVEPIGEIWREGASFRARLDEQDLGAFDTGDEAAEAVWSGFIEQSSARHAHASVTHGGRERHA